MFEAWEAISASGALERSPLQNQVFTREDAEKSIHQ